MRSFLCRNFVVNEFTQRNLSFVGLQPERCGFPIHSAIPLELRNQFFSDPVKGSDYFSTVALCQLFADFK
jgi:hypothetical protein